MIWLATSSRSAEPGLVPVAGVGDSDSSTLPNRWMPGISDGSRACLRLSLLAQAEHEGDHISRLFRCEDQVWHLRVRRLQKRAERGRRYSGCVGYGLEIRPDCDSSL